MEEDRKEPPLQEQQQQHQGEEGEEEEVVNQEDVGGGDTDPPPPSAAVAVPPAATASVAPNDDEVAKAAAAPPAAAAPAAATSVASSPAPYTTRNNNNSTSASSSSSEKGRYRPPENVIPVAPPPNRGGGLRLAVGDVSEEYGMGPAGVQPSPPSPPPLPLASGNSNAPPSTNEDDAYRRKIQGNQRRRGRNNNNNNNRRTTTPGDGSVVAPNPEGRTTATTTETTTNGNSTNVTTATTAADTISTDGANPDSSRPGTDPGMYMAPGAPPEGDAPVWRNRHRDSTPLLQATLVKSQRFPSAMNVQSVDGELMSGRFSDVTTTIASDVRPVNNKRTLLIIAASVIIAVISTVVVVTLLVGRDDEADPDFPPFSLSDVVATVPELICFERNPGAGESDYCSVNDTITRGGGVANLVAQTFLVSHPDADIAIQNSGGCRGDIRRGDFTGRDAYALLPFNNQLFLLQMTGEELKLVLEEGLHQIYADPDDPVTGAYPYAAGLKFAVNMSKGFGGRLSNIQTKDRSSQVWVPLISTQIYSVVANSFIVEGGDNYTQFSKVQDRKEIENDSTNAFLRYAIEEGVLLDPPEDDYSTISYVPP